MATYPTRGTDHRTRYAKSPRMVMVQGSRTVFASPWVLMSICPELPSARCTMRCNTCSVGLSGDLNTMTSRTARRSTGTRSEMASPPTESPGRMLPDCTGVVIQVPRARATPATPARARTATNAKASTPVTTRFTKVTRLDGRRCDEGLGLPFSGYELVIEVPTARGAICFTPRACLLQVRSGRRYAPWWRRHCGEREDKGDAREYRNKNGLVTVPRDGPYPSTHSGQKLGGWGERFV